MSKLVSHKEYLLMEVSAELIDKIKVKGNKMYYGTYRFGYFHQWLPEGQYQKIGGGHQLKDSDWEGIVGYDTFEGEDEKYWHFYVEGGIKANIFKDTATQSGLSLLASHDMKASGTLILKKI